MIEKDEGIWAALIEVAKQCSPFVSTFVLSAWGGVVSHIQRMRETKSVFRPKELAFDLIISSFAGLLTYMFCKSAKLDGEMSAILIAVSGHMGTRAIAGFEQLRNRVFGVVPEQPTKGNDDDKQP